MDLSLLVAYRNRPEQLQSLLSWFPESLKGSGCEIELILVESSQEPSLDPSNLPFDLKYYFEYGDGFFNKSKLLNKGLMHAKGQYVTPLDVDMFPVDLSFTKHLMMARESEKFLISGYRMLTSWESFKVDQLGKVQQSVKVAIESIYEPWVYDQLVHKHRFGHLPFFLKKHLIALNGWDENYVGWGAEDQDMIQRYLGSERFLMVSPDLVYLHLKHGTSEDWNNEELKKKNRAYFYEKHNLSPNTG